MDDIVLAAPSTEPINWLQLQSDKEFDMTDLGNLRTFLGLAIYRDPPKRTFHLSQRCYIERILDLHGIWNSNWAPTPADRHVKLKQSSQDFEASAVGRQRYQSHVASLMYSMLETCPDITYTVSKVSQYSSNPNLTHWTAMKRIFRYLAGTPALGLCYKLQRPGDGFTDADCSSGEDRPSIPGFAFVLGGAAHILWSSKKQSTAALSSTEAEYMALTQAVKESIWL